jgi:hypothetical protein
MDAVEGWEAYTRAFGMSIDVRLGAAYKTTRLLSICSWEGALCTSKGVPLC